jgi:hypothetical protein
VFEWFFEERFFEERFFEEPFFEEPFFLFVGNGWNSRSGYCSSGR